MVNVKSFTSEIKIFQTINELRNLDAQVNSFIKGNKIKKIISISDCATSDDKGATIGIIRAVAYEEPKKSGK